MSQQDMNNLSQEEMIEMQKKNCIFCKIISKEIPSNEIYSDDKVMIILDINPANEGHCIIIPKQHYQILPQLSDSLIEHMSILAKRTSKALLRSLGVKGTTIFIANGAIAGQKSPHYMMHVIPRKDRDMLFMIPKHKGEEKLLEELRILISGRLGANGKPKAIAHKAEKETKPEEKVSVEESDAKEEKEEKIDFDKLSDLFG
jgi:histidine triad (HIT) family protein